MQYVCGGVNIVDPGCYPFGGLLLTMFSCRPHIIAQVNTLVMLIAIAADQNKVSQKILSDITLSNLTFDSVQFSWFKSPFD